MDWKCILSFCGVITIAVYIASPVRSSGEPTKVTWATPYIGADATNHMAAVRAARKPRRRVMSVTTNDGWRIVRFDDLTSRSNRVTEVRLSKPAKIKYGYPQEAK